MIALTAFAGQTIALFGLGGSGLATALALRAGGAHVAAWDDNADARAAAKAREIAIVDLRAADWSSYQSLVLSPGVPLTHPSPHWAVDRAMAAGVEIIGDIELFCRQRRDVAPGSRFIAITGTNGKSTTTALIAHMLGCFGRQVAVGGNLGTPVLQLVPPSSDSIHVVECSSFQIDLSPTIDPSLGILLNLAPDHLDRHGSMALYAKIKARLVVSAHEAIVGIDDADCRAIADAREAAGRHPTRISAQSIAGGHGVFADGATIVHVQGDRRTVLADLSGIDTLRGSHNAQNAAAAVAAVIADAPDAEAMQAALRSFPGLPHRMEEVGRDHNILFINDSKATNADAAGKALAAFGDGIFWIAGGKAKSDGIEALRPFFGRLAKVYLIGESSERFARTIGTQAMTIACGTLDAALDMAARDAAQSDAAQPVVLLSPACASYDQFSNFEARGNRFRDLVHARLAQPQV